MTAITLGQAAALALGGVRPVPAVVPGAKAPSPAPRLAPVPGPA